MKTPRQIAIPWKSGDYYRRLGVVRGANPGEIEAAYRRLALRYQHDSRKLASFAAAYGVLIVPHSRSKHDAELAAKEEARNRARVAQREPKAEKASVKEWVMAALDVANEVIED